MNPRRVLAVLAVAELFAMAPWFSASAVAPALARAWELSAATTAWLTISVQLGFVVGALVSAILTLADRFSARRLVAGWFKEGRGLAIGILVGALTLGSAGPHLVRWIVAPAAWRIVLIVAAGSALAGGLLVLLVPSDGPFAAPSPPFSLSAAPRILEDEAVALANLGYLGHMWELYAMWTWMAAFVAASEHARGGAAIDVPAETALVTFAVVGSGAIYLLPAVAARIGWRWSMSALAIGPALGVWAMLALRRRPEARQLAGGAR